MHYVGEFEESALAPVPLYANHSQGYTQTSLVDHIKAGNVVWTGVGCVHSFANKGQAPVRWLETFSPQPPAENAFRFMAEWEKKAKELQ